MLPPTKSTITTALCSGLLLGTVACGTSYDYDEPKDFREGSGQEAMGDELAYPPGPYGYGIGSVIPPYEFIGYQHPESELYGPMRRINLAEYYNPTGVELYAPGGGMPEGAPRPVALLLSMSAVWCPPCNQEADSILPVRYTNLKPRGAEFLVNLADSAMPGSPATKGNLDAWIEKYDIEYPLVLDPTYKLSPVMAQPAWPANFIIDTRTMRIAKSVAGSPDSLFWNTMSQVLDGTFDWPE
jgi:hypothetical protein